MKKSSFTSILTIIISILLVLAVIGGISVFYKYSDGFESDFSNFYAEVDGETITNEKKGVVLSKYKEYKVDVGYLFSSEEKEKAGFTVTVEPNSDEDTDFSFKVGSRQISFADNRDYSNGFDINIKEDGFTIRPLGPLNTVISKCYDSQSVTNSTEPFADMFSLVITSGNGKSTVKIYFTLWE